MRVLELLDDHAVMNKALTRARCAWFERRVEDSHASWAFLATLLEQHMTFEERVLMPQFEKLPGVSANLSARVLRRDHAFIRRLLQTSLGDEPVGVCDAMAQLAGVLEHHDLREAKAFKPMLDEQLGLRANELLAPYAKLRHDLGAPPAPNGRRAPPGPTPTRKRPIDASREYLARGDIESAASCIVRLLALKAAVPAKARRLASTAADALRAPDPIAAWDQLRLARIILDHRPNPASAETGGPTN